MLKFITIFLLFPFACMAQSSNIDCAKVLDATPYFATRGFSVQNDSSKLDMDILKTCGNIQQDELWLFSPLIGMAILKASQQNRDEKITYRSILDTIAAFRNSEQYKVLKKAKDIGEILAVKKFSRATWEEDKQLLLEFHIKPHELDELKEYFVRNEDKNWTYAIALMNYNDERRQKIEEEELNFEEFNNLEDALQKGKTNDMHILIYFTAYADVNSRKMEENIFKDKVVKSLMRNNYLIFRAFADDQRKNESGTSTVGKHIQTIQKEAFNSNSQPAFFILRTDGTTHSTFGYTSDAKEFREFLRKGAPFK